MSSFFALNIDKFIRNSDGTFGLKYVSGIMCKDADNSFVSTTILIIRAVSVTVVVVAISLFFGFCWNLFLKFVTYCKDFLRDFGRGVKNFLMTTLTIFGLIIAFPILYVLSMILSRRKRRSREEWVEERRERRSHSLSTNSSDSEIIVIEESSPPRRRREYSRDRSYRSSKPTSYSVFGGLLSVLGLKPKSETVVVERYSGQRRSSSRRYQTEWFRGPQRRRTETVIEEELYARRGSTSSDRRWYGDYGRRSVSRRSNWLPWNWFRKTQPLVQRRGRVIQVENEPNTSSLQRIYAWLMAHFVTPLLRLFGLTKSTLVEERASDFSSYFSNEYGSGTNSHASSSIRASDTESRRTRRSRRSRR